LGVQKVSFSNSRIWSRGEVGVHAALSRRRSRAPFGPYLRMQPSSVRSQRMPRSFPSCSFWLWTTRAQRSMLRVPSSRSASIIRRIKSRSHRCSSSC
jgi:hypothetical protein